VAQLGARLDGIEEVVGSNPIGSTNLEWSGPEKRVPVSLFIVLGLLYGGDYFYLRFRMLHPRPADPFKSLQVLRVLAIPEKNGKTEYEIDTQNTEHTVTCVHSLFPHGGYSPCWYAKPRVNQPIPI
jgi:hypothetical protein